MRRWGIIHYLVMEEDKMKRLVFVFPAVLAFMFILVGVLGRPTTAVSGGSNCEDRLLPTSSFTCTVVDEFGNQSPGMTLDFAAGSPGDFHVTINGGPVAACACKSKGGFTKPKFETSIKFRCNDNTSVSSPIEGIDFDFSSATLEGRTTNRKKIAAGAQGVDKDGNSIVYSCDEAPPITAP